jgi:hypothetical protein
VSAKGLKEAIVRLRELAAEIELLAISEEHGLVIVQPPVKRERSTVAARIIRARRDRGKHFPAVFGEPAWEILLDLYVAAQTGKQVSVSSACIASARPPTTGLRWLRSLECHGLVERYADPTDRRRAWVRLSAGAARAMDAWIDSVQD